MNHRHSSQISTILLTLIFAYPIIASETSDYVSSSSSTSYSSPSSSSSCFTSSSSISSTSSSERTPELADKSSTFDFQNLFAYTLHPRDKHYALDTVLAGTLYAMGRLHYIGTAQCPCKHISSSNPSLATAFLKIAQQRQATQKKYTDLYEMSLDLGRLCAQNTDVIRYIQGERQPQTQPDLHKDLPKMIPNDILSEEDLKFTKEINSYQKYYDTHYQTICPNRIPHDTASLGIILPFILTTYQNITKKASTNGRYILSDSRCKDAMKRIADQQSTQEKIPATPAIHELIIDNMIMNLEESRKKGSSMDTSSSS